MMGKSSGNTHLRVCRCNRTPQAVDKKINWKLCPAYHVLHDKVEGRSGSKVWWETDFWFLASYFPLCPLWWKGPRTLNLKAPFQHCITHHIPEALPLSSIPLEIGYPYLNLKDVTFQFPTVLCGSVPSPSWPCVVFLLCGYAHLGSQKAGSTDGCIIVTISWSNERLFLIGRVWLRVACSSAHHIRKMIWHHLSKEGLSKVEKVAWILSHFYLSAGSLKEEPCTQFLVLSFGMDPEGI